MKNECPLCGGLGVADSKPLTFGDLLIGECFIGFPMDGDDSGHGGFQEGHNIFIKLNYKDGEALSMTTKRTSKFPRDMLVVKVLM